ncbi:hypothetical protein BFW38_15600 [Terasakiispira papahanaumokuakeensis]|uniref:Uncharacterized protein n=1 Tax=Terasakiispira papahanaumokuakeensis TaxID=197479 RepID=A0A1E2VD12_9GAMM|nr:hypothetical protein [Terasakiispira papahanaumokuakeensis]ODC04742.1 hypothetical protein BFW38_15600 [Terasakiispira papahanaumokuakeensis]
MSQDFYRFNLQDNQVISVMEWDDGRWEQDHIEADETYTVEDNRIILEERDDDEIEVSVFEATSVPGIYLQTQEYDRPLDLTPQPPQQDDTSTSTQFLDEDPLRVTLSATGDIERLEEWDDGRWETEHLDHDEQAFINTEGLLVIEELDDGGLETTVYQDNGQGIYQAIQAQFEYGKGLTDTTQMASPSPAELAGLNLPENEAALIA